MITSADNPKIKHIRSLLTQRKARDEHQQCVLENERFITDNLKKHPGIFDSLFYTDKHPVPILEQAIAHNIPCYEVSPKIFQTLHSVKTSFGIIAVLNKPKTLPPKTFKKALYLDGINKPQNLGAIIRSAAAFSLDVVFLSPETCDPFHPESIRAMAGHLHAIPMVTMPFSSLITAYPNASIYCLSEKAESSIQDITFKTPSVFVMGSETGFSNNVINSKHPKTPVKIPINADVDSLNVAVAAGIVLWSFRE
jgi:TrmH family RNA methyltransferase